MLHIVRLAFRNAFRQKKRSITLGVNYALVAMLLTLLLAFSRGAARNVSESLAAATAGHITITGSFAKDGKIYSGMLRRESIEKAIAETFGASARTVVRYGMQSAVYFQDQSKRVGFVGIEAERDLALRDQASFVSGSWEDFALDPNGVAIPAELSEYFGLAIGDEIVLSSRTRFGAFNTGILVVRGIYVTDNYFSRGQVLAHLEALRALDLASPDAATSIFVYLATPSKLGAQRDSLAAALRALDFEVSVPATDRDAIAAISAASSAYEEDKEGRDRVMLNAATLDEALGIVRTVLKAVNGAGAFVAAVMLFVIAVSIFINLRMSVNERLREIGTMRAIGLEAYQVGALFVLESVSLAAVFSGIGVALATGIALLLRVGPAFPAGSDLGLVLSRGRLVLEPSVLIGLGVICTISAFAAVFSWFPARKGASIPPVEALASTF